MQWDECMKKNLVKMKRKDPELARSLLKIAIERVKFFSSRDVSVFMLEGIYEAILEVCHAFLALEKYISKELEIFEILKNELEKRLKIQS